MMRTGKTINSRTIYRHILFLGAFLAALLLPGQSYGQTGSHNGRLEGSVVDPSGALVTHAAIDVRSEETGASEATTTDDQGHFVFPALEPGAYQVSVSANGFAQSVFTHVVVNVGATATLKATLSIAAVNQETTVNASTATQVTLDNVSSAVSTVIDQRAIDVLPLNGRNFVDFVLLSSGSTTDGDFGMVSFNGIAGNFNNYSVDGGNNNNAFYAQQIGRTSIPYQFSEDVIKEFQVTSTGFEAEFGQAGGGIVNIVTKDGSNSFHGDAYYYLLDSALNANDSINKSNGLLKPSNRRQQFGGTVSGPLLHDRLFYIANYEGQLRNEPIVANNLLPAGFLAANPSLQPLLTGVGVNPRSFNQNTAFGKILGSLNDKNTFTATYNYQRFRSPHGYFSSPTSTGDGLSLTDGATSNFVQFWLQSTFNATTVNELTLHFGQDTHFDLPATSPATPTITIQNPDTGSVYGGNRFQLSETDRRYQIRDNITKLVGKHIFKAGADFNLSHERDYFVYGPKGEYRFADLASVATGAFELYLQSFGQSTAKYSSPTYSFFAQDEYRLTNHLNFNYGLRYDLQVLPQPSNCNPALALTCKIPYGRNNFAPRAGFAYGFGPGGSTVVRGNFGLFYIQENLLDVSQGLLSNGIARQFLVATGPGFGNSSPIVTFPNSLTAFPTGVSVTPSVVVFAPNFRNPYVEQGNLGLEQQFGKHLAVGATYVYSHGLRLLGNSNGVTRQANGNFGFDLNLVAPGQQPAYGGSFTTDTVFLPNGQSYVAPDFEAIDGALDPNFGAINAIDNSGKSIYHALQTELRYRSSQWYGLIGYSFSKTIDQGTGYFNQFDQASQRGLSQLDQTHRFVASGSWTPQLRPLRGFTFAGVATLASGRPYTAVFDTPQVNFSVVPGEGFNSFRDAGVQDVDFSLARNFKLTERVGLRLRVESFNIFNHANFQQGVVNNIQYTLAQRTDSMGNGLNLWDATTNPMFGQPLAAAPRYGARSLQFSTRINF
ncbi:MAG TPA: TonB-dependent receptor [Candidatus Angelobacter sp.]|nr:TonB-dependent receptor [Candidatus Angelobacter sp.]